MMTWALSLVAIIAKSDRTLRSWEARHDRLENLIVMLMQHSGISAKGEPRNVVNGLIPRPLLKDYTQEDRSTD